MASEVLMPALSPTMTEGKIARWVKSEGETVRAGDVLAEIETDKATMEVEAVDEGVLAKIVIPEGTDHVAVNTPIAVIAENGEDVGSVEAKPARREPNGAGAAQAKEAPQPAEQDQEPTPPQPAARGKLEPAPTPPRVAPGPDASEYAGPTVTQTVREALRDAMAEEMRRDGNVFLIGEEVAEYQGAYKISQGLLQEFGPRRVIDTPITEQGFTGLGIGAAFAGLRPIVEFMTFNFAMQEDPEFLVPIGKARIARAGEHVTITAFSRMVKLALQAAEELAKAGISAEVIDLRSLRPFDVATVAESVKKTNRIVSVEEGWPFAGIGAELAAIAVEECFDWLDAPPKRVAGKDVPLPYAANLERLAVPQVDDIVAAAKEATYR